MQKHFLTGLPLLASQHVSFRCYYPDGSHTCHVQFLAPSEFVTWLQCYKFTHPDCIYVTMRLGLQDPDPED